MKLCCLTLLACSVLPSTMVLAARDIYVNNVEGDDRSTGDMQNNSTVKMGPVRTIAKALRLARPGDHVVLASTGQPYRESVSLSGMRLSGAGDDLPVVITGNGAVLDGSVPVPDDAWEHYLGDIFRFRPSRARPPAIVYWRPPGGASPGDLARPESARPGAARVVPGRRRIFISASNQASCRKIISRRMPRCQSASRSIKFTTW